MYSLGSLIVELQTARRRLLKVFEVPNGTPTSGLRTHRIPNAAIDWLFGAPKTALNSLRYDFDSAQAMEIGQPPQLIQRRHLN
jgi:hypothetical protein